MTREVFIDLDDRDDWRDESQPVAPQRKPPYRAIALAVVVALLLGLPTLSIRPQPHIVQLGLFPRPASDEWGLRLVGDVVISTNARTVIASNLDGTVRWTYRPDTNFDDVYVAMDPESSLFLVSVMSLSHPGGNGIYRFISEQTIALDPATGQQRWRIDGGGTWRGGSLVSMDDSRIRVYQRDPPALRWEASGFVRTFYERNVAGKSVWGLKSDGTLSEMDLESGSVLRSGTLPPSAVAGATGERGNAFVLRDLLVVEGEAVVVFDLNTLQPLPWASDWLPEYECGAILCGRQVPGRSGVPAMGGLDPRTGAVVWMLPAQLWMWPTELGMVAVRSSGQNFASIVGLIDPDTGRVRVPVEDWHTMTWSGSSPMIIVRMQQGRTFLGVMTAGGPRVLGSVNHLLGSCENSANTIMCDLPDGNVGVWQLNV